MMILSGEHCSVAVPTAVGRRSSWACEIIIIYFFFLPWNRTFFPSHIAGVCTARMSSRVCAPQSGSVWDRVPRTPTRRERNAAITISCCLLPTSRPSPWRATEGVKCGCVTRKHTCKKDKCINMALRARKSHSAVMRNSAIRTVDGTHP